MSSASAGASRSGAPASLPPSGLPGLNASFSRLIDVPERHSTTRSTRRWHILDNAPALAELGVQPVGTVLCVHGNPTWSYLWRRLLSSATDAAADGGQAWRVIAVDQLNMGFSERTGEGRPLARRVRDLDDLTNALSTDALGLAGPIVTLGHDWGGVVSLGWAVDHPELLAGVMLLNTAVHQPEGEPIPAPLRLALHRSLLRPATVATPAFLETTLALAHPSLPSPVKDAYRSPYRRAARRAGIGDFVADIPVHAGHESAPELDRIAHRVGTLRVPALMLWGPRDPVFSDRYLDDLARRMPHADIHRFEGAGHLIAEDVDYASAVLTWLGDKPLVGQASEAATSVARADTVPDTDAGAGTIAGIAPVTDGGRQPLWHHLDDLRDSDDPALVEMVPARGQPSRSVSWRLLSKRVRQLAAGLAAVGVSRGDRVSLLVPPGADLTAVLYACLRIGAVVVVADAGLGLRGLTRAVRGARPDHLIGAVPGLIAARALGWPGQRISTARYPAPVARALGVSSALADLIERGRDEVLPDPPGSGEIAAVLFTSGSTGPAKGVVYTHDQLAAVRDALAAQYEVGVGTGLVAGFAPFALLGPALGALSVTPDMDVTSPKTLTAASVAAAVRAVEATVVFLSPAALANVVATEHSLTPEDRSALDGVLTFLSAGAPVSEQLLAAASALMPDARAHTPYGMTEALLVTDVTLTGIREAATAEHAEGGSGGVCVGVPAPSAHVRISALDPTGAATGVPAGTPGVTGEIVISAPQIKDHYDRLWLTNRAADAAVTTGERWHRTGDVGHLDASGRLWVEGRMPHVITTGAGLITPVALEQRIDALPAVRRSAVVGVGPQGVQHVIAVLETTARSRRVHLAEPDLAAAVRDAVQGPDVAAVLVVPQLPTDIRHNSKIDRTRLSEWAAGVLAGGRMVKP